MRVDLRSKVIHFRKVFAAKVDPGVNPRLLTAQREIKRCVYEINLQPPKGGNNSQESKT
jgi:hypothetical protein